MIMNNLANNIEIQQIFAGIYNTLVANEQLVAKLAESRPVNNPNGALLRENSIVPMTKIMDETGSRPVPLIGIRAGNMVRAGNHTFDVFVFIRCYTGLDKAFVENNAIMSLINQTLDNQYISVETAVVASMQLEQLTGEEYDEGYKLNYREGQFRLSIT